MKSEKPLLSDLLPEVFSEVCQLLESAGRRDLLASLNTARVVDKCRCEDEFCSSIYMVCKPSGTWGPKHVTVPLIAENGMINLDIVEDKIVYLEILYRPDIKGIVDDRIANF